MRIVDILRDEQCSRLFSEVNAFVNESLGSYNRSFSTENEYLPKDIFDFVWGTVELSAAEMLVLDSPLLQRLRRIHHLGMADVLYCNATSSRFSHTIGVVEVANRMASMVSKNLGDNWGNGKDFTEVVKMAAIFHDVGHVVYSHVSERFFVYNELFPRHNEITKALAHFREKTSTQCAFHELLSVMIVNADETKKLIKNASNYMSWALVKNEKIQEFIDYISGLIIGSPIDEDILPFSQIINGAIDADKLDYLSRDSECTKVPIAVDIARIIQKLTVVSVKKIDMSAIWNGSNNETEPLRIMGIKNSAKKVFFQLSSARSIMFESVYYHHKVLTVETMFRIILKHYFEGISEDKISFTDIMSWTDDSFSEYWKHLCPSELVVGDFEKEVSFLIDKIKRRELYKRVAAFSEDSLEGQYPMKNSFVRNVIQRPNSDDNAKFCKLLNEEYRIICGLDDVEADESSFIFAFSKYEAMSSAPIDNGEGCCVWSSSLVKQETMEAGRKSKQEQLYLLTDCKRRDLAYLAFEKVLYDMYKIVLKDDASICLKSSKKNLQKVRELLLQKDYYMNNLSIINDGLFNSIIQKEKISDIVNKYHHFQGCEGEDLDEKKVIGYLRQFLIQARDYNHLVSLYYGLCRLINCGIFINRELYSKAVNFWLKKIELERYLVVILGSMKDSSAHYSYFFNDNENKDKIVVKNSLSDALKEKDGNNTICFFDDGAYSGKQIISIFQEYMGVPAEKRFTQESHVSELSETEKDALKKATIKIMFVVFNENNQDSILSELSKLGLNDVEIVYYKGIGEKIGDRNDIFDTGEQRTLVCDSLRSIGEELVKSTKINHNNWDEKRIREAALGYNDSQQVVVTLTSVPTYTITALWMEGEYCGIKWKPLFERTAK